MPASPFGGPSSAGHHVDIPAPGHVGFLSRRRDRTAYGGGKKRPSLAERSIHSFTVWIWLVELSGPALWFPAAPNFPALSLANSSAREGLEHESRLGGRPLTLADHLELGSGEVAPLAAPDAVVQLELVGVGVREEPGCRLALCRPNLRCLSWLGGVEGESPTGMACIGVRIAHNGVIDVVVRVVALVDQPLACP